MSDSNEWAVYEQANGQVWTCTPPTRERAEHETALAGAGHEAVPRDRAQEMRNAWCHGRMAGIEWARADA